MRLIYDSNSAAKVEFLALPGGEFDVPDEVAADLIAANPHFKPVGRPRKAPEVATSETVERPAPRTRISR